MPSLYAALDMDFLDGALFHQCHAGFKRGNVNQDIFVDGHLVFRLRMADFVFLSVLAAAWLCDVCLSTVKRLLLWKV
jgi:hypothetical protein